MKVRSVFQAVTVNSPPHRKYSQGQILHVTPQLSNIVPLGYSSRQRATQR